MANDNKKKKRAQAAREAERARKARRDQLVLGLGVLVLVGGLVGFVAFGGGEPDVGVTNAGAWDLPALDEELDAGLADDGRFRLADYEGTPLVVNFFASWCTACESELPRFRDAAVLFDDELEIVFVNSNESGNWRPMAERTGITDHPLIRDINGTADNGLYRSLGGTGGMPITAFYDENGQLVNLDRGELSTDALATRLAQLYGLTR